MAILFRVLLISLLIYLVVRMVREWMAGPPDKEEKVKTSAKSRTVSKDVGEYVDFEEIKKEKGERQTTKDERGTGEKGSRVSDKRKGTRDFR